jgi:acyl dehydratase
MAIDQRNGHQVTLDQKVPHLVQGQTFEQMLVGSRFRTAARTVTETDLVGFISAVGITEPLFLDARHAAEGGYRGRLVPGVLTYALAEGLVLQTNVLHGTGLAFLEMKLEALKPVCVGDTIEVIVEVTASRPTSGGDRGVVTTLNTVLNQDGELVLRYTPVRLIRGQNFVPRNVD